MNKKQHKVKKWIFIILIIVLLVLLLFSRCQEEASMSPDKEISQEVGIVNDIGSISIPGYEGLTLEANSKKQTISLSNPAQNQCYFQISLFLEDGTELWQSDLIKPGETSKPIKLKQKLEVGTYTNAFLKYSCFKMDKDLTPLNGAETKLTLWVK